MPRVATHVSSRVRTVGGIGRQHWNLVRMAREASESLPPSCHALCCPSPKGWVSKEASPGRASCHLKASRTSPPCASRTGRSSIAAGSHHAMRMLHSRRMLLLILQRPPVLLKLNSGELNSYLPHPQIQGTVQSDSKRKEKGRRMNDRCKCMVNSCAVAEVDDRCSPPFAWVSEQGE